LSRLFKVVLPVAFVAAGIVVAGYLVATKPEAPARERAERTWRVETVPVAFEDVQPDLCVFGQIVAGRVAELRPLVAGPVAEVGENFVDGGRVQAGDLLVAIDPFDYERDLAERKASRAEAIARLDELQARRRAEQGLLEEDRVQRELSQRDYERRERLVGGAVSEKALDDARLALSQAEARVLVREQSIGALAAQIEQQKSVVARLDAAVARAERNLADTRLLAPFDGYLADTAAAVGQRLATGDRIGRLIDASRLEARVYLSDSEFGRVLAADGTARGPATVLWRTGGRTLEFPAAIDRMEGEIDAATGGVHLYLQFKNLDLSAPLRAGAFVEAVLKDRLYEDVAVLPEAALFDGDTVYAVVDGRLAPRQVEVVGRAEDRVFVRGEIAPDESIVTTRLAEIGPGLRVAAQ